MGTCRSCRSRAVLTLTESRYVRPWHQRLAAGFDPQVARTASCSACSATYPVRLTDLTADAAAGRGAAGGAARDWDYSRTG